MTVNVDNPIALLIICFLPFLLVVSIVKGIRKRIDLIQDLTSGEIHMNKSLRWMPLFLLVFTIASVLFMAIWFCAAFYSPELAFSKFNGVIFIIIIGGSMILGDLYIKRLTKK